MRKLSEIKCNEIVTIVDINCNDNTRRRMIDIGLNKGAKVHIERFAPLGDPILLSIRGFRLAIRKSDAQGITVE